MQSLKLGSPPKIQDDCWLRYLIIANRDCNYTNFCDGHTAPNLESYFNFYLDHVFSILNVLKHKKVEMWNNLRRVLGTPFSTNAFPKTFVLRLATKNCMLHKALCIILYYGVNCDLKIGQSFMKVLKSPPVFSKSWKLIVFG